MPLSNQFKWHGGLMGAMLGELGIWRNAAVSETSTLGDQSMPHKSKKPYYPKEPGHPGKKKK